MCVCVCIYNIHVYISIHVRCVFVIEAGRRGRVLRHQATSKGAIGQRNLAAMFTRARVLRNQCVRTYIPPVASEIQGRMSNERSPVAGLAFKPASVSPFVFPLLRSIPRIVSLSLRLTLPFFLFFLSAKTFRNFVDTSVSFGARIKVIRV